MSTPAVSSVSSLSSLLSSSPVFPLRLLRLLPPSLEGVQSVHFQFNPLESSSRGTKSALNLFLGRGLRRSNMSCVISQSVDFANPPAVTFEFSDKSKTTFYSAGQRAERILAELSVLLEKKKNLLGLRDEEDMADEEDDEKK